jgi:hypothetical protein
MDTSYYFLDGRLVYQSLLPWWNVHDPWPKALQITLGKTGSLLCGLFFAIFVTFTGSRLWSVTRHLILPGDSSSISHDPNNQIHEDAVDDLYQIQQNESIKLWIRHRKPKLLNMVLQENPRLRAVLGAAAVLNYLISLVLSLLLVWLLTGLGANAAVKSTSTTACAPFEAEGDEFRKAFTASANYFQSCWLQNNETSLCKVSPSFFKPGINIETVDCPFTKSACLPGYESRMLTYELTTESIGLNLRSSGIRLQYRLIYSALDLSYFIGEKMDIPIFTSTIHALRPGIMIHPS